MKNISDKELDEIFKQAAERIDVTFNPSAWEKFETKIQNPRTNGYNKTIISIVVLFIMFTGTFVWRLSTPQNHNREQLIGSIVQQQHKEITNEVTNIDVPGQHQAGNKQTQESLRIEDHRQIKAGASLSINSIDVKQNASALFQIDNGLLVSNSKLINASIFNVVQDVQNDISKASPLSPYSNASTYGTGTVPLISPVKVPIRKGKTFRPYFSAGFKVAPDFSGTGISTFSKTGNNMGVALEYHISRRLSISTGMIRSRKIYAVTDGFNPYEGYWDYKAKPDLIDGGCIVLDIPLNIRYNLLVGERSSVFLSTGLSSYLMTKENYNYIYYSYQKDYEIRNQNNHIFGIYNLSAGYDRFIGRNWSINLEPFVKIPITEVGYGNLKLMSAGAFISLNYHFFNKKGRTLK